MFQKEVLSGVCSLANDYEQLSDDDDKLVSLETLKTQQQIE